MRHPIATAAILGALVLGTATASADDPGGALDELKQGYALKQADNCREALPHFARSAQLADSPKALLNLGDCEQRLGDLVSARKHTLEGRALAVKQSDAELAGVADIQLESLERRLPRLSVKLAAGAPSGCVVTLDDVAIPAASLGVAEPINPGAHQITVTAPGRIESNSPVVIGEGEQRATEVAPGPIREPAVAPAVTPVAAAGFFESLGPRKLAAIGLGGIGLVGVVVGSAFGLHAIAKNDDSNANGHCDQFGCDPTGKQLRNQALGDATVSTVAFVLGLASVASGIVIYATAPQEGRRAARLQLRPLLTPGVGTMLLQGSW